MDDELTDQLIPKLMDLFKMPEEQREFMFDFYIPEVNSTLIVVLAIFSFTLRLPAMQENVQYTANEGPVRMQCKCLVPIYVFPEMKLCSLLISKTEL